MRSASLGQMIRSRRKELKLTIDDLAKKVGVDRTYIGKIENHGILPLPKVLIKIVKSLDDNSNKYIRLYKALKVSHAITAVKKRIITIPDKF
jgi:transcriptional regulator with XRE-family HTH domain